MSWSLDSTGILSPYFNDGINAESVSSLQNVSLYPVLLLKAHVFSGRLEALMHGVYIVGGGACIRPTSILHKCLGVYLIIT